MPLDSVKTELTDNHQDLRVLIRPVSGLYQTLLAGRAPALRFWRFIVGCDFIEAEAAIAL